MQDVKQITSSLIAKENKELNCIEVVDLRRNINFLIDYEDSYILDKCHNFSKTNFRKNVNNSYISAFNFNNNGRSVALTKIILSKEINEYKKIYGRNPIIVRKDLSENPFDYRKSNLEIISSRANIPNFRNNIYSNNSGYIGVYITPYGTYQMTIMDPNTKKQIVKFYNTAEEAALMYDYFANIFYPGETITNFHLNKYPPGYLESKNIYSINDIQYIESNTSNSTSTNFYGWIGMRPSRRNKNVIVNTVRTIDKKYKQIGSTEDISELGLLKLAAKREEFICRNPDLVSPNIKSNLVFPEPEPGQIVIAGILKKSEKK